MAKRKILTAARLREVLHYNPDTGEFTRIVPGRRKVGRITWYGKSRNKYLAIGIDNQRYFAHRLAFLYMTGKWPTGDVDHINGNGLENWWSNLRLATRSQNNINRRTCRRNKSGYCGVRWHKGMRRWQAIFSFTYRTKNEAIKARMLMVKILAKEFAPTQNGAWPHRVSAT